MGLTMSDRDRKPNTAADKKADSLRLKPRRPQRNLQVCMFVFRPKRSDIEQIEVEGIIRRKELWENPRKALRKTN